MKASSAARPGLGRYQRGRFYLFGFGSRRRLAGGRRLVDRRIGGIRLLRIRLIAFALAHGLVPNWLFTNC